MEELPHHLRVPKGLGVMVVEERGTAAGEALLHQQYPLPYHQPKT